METTITPFLSSFFILLREGFEAMLIAVLNCCAGVYVFR